MKQIKNGFTLIETMFALVVAALIIAPLMRLLSKTIDVVSQQELRLFDQASLERFLYESRMYADQKENFERQETLNQQKTMFFTRAPLAIDKSNFSQPFLCKERVFIKDTASKKEFTYELVTFYTVLPEIKEKEAKKTKEAGEPKTEDNPHEEL